MAKDNVSKFQRKQAAQVMKYPARVKQSGAQLLFRQNSQKVSPGPIYTVSLKMSRAKSGIKGQKALKHFSLRRQGAGGQGARSDPPAPTPRYVPQRCPLFMPSDGPRKINEHELQEEMEK